MNKILESEECRAQLIELYCFPILKLSPQGRSRCAPTKIKTLYHLYQLNKNVQHGKWTANFQSVRRMAADADVSERHFYEVIQNPDFSLFGKIKHRCGTTSIYSLHSWVAEFFHFFEAKGMMKGFRSDFKTWKEKFIKRFRNWLLPLLRKGFSLAQILMNKLSTKNPLKGVGSASLKGARMKPSDSSHEAFQGSKSNLELPPIQAIQELTILGRKLQTDIHLKEGDIHQVINSFSLRQIKGGLRLYEETYRYASDVRSPIKTFMWAINASIKGTHGRKLV